MPDSAERSFVAEPELPDSVSASELDPEVRRDLRGLQKETAEVVARHLVAAGVLVDTDTELALHHARYARKRASRIAVVREAAGIVAYHAGEWNEALGEFRAARRMGGGPGHVPVMADIERALGRPERALDLARSPEAKDLSQEERIELLIVAAGARRDLGELEAAVVGLQVPELDGARRDPWTARLCYAYADNLLAVGRESEAIRWFVHAHDADADGGTDAAQRIAELTGEELPGFADEGVSVEFEDVPVDGTGPAVAADGPEGDATGDGIDPATDTTAADGADADTTDAEGADAEGADADGADAETGEASIPDADRLTVAGAGALGADADTTDAEDGEEDGPAAGGAGADPASAPIPTDPDDTDGAGSEQR